MDNGVWTVLINTHRNHRRDWPMDLFNAIARVAPGSFGFLHLWDDEYPTEGERFMRLAMVDGQIAVQEERALNPIVKRWLAAYERRA